MCMLTGNESLIITGKCTMYAHDLFVRNPAARHSKCPLLIQPLYAPPDNSLFCRRRCNLPRGNKREMDRARTKGIGDTQLMADVSGQCSLCIRPSGRAQPGRYQKSRVCL